MAGTGLDIQPFPSALAKKEVKEWLRLQSTPKIDRALEIGCGLGRGARLLIEKLHCRKVVAFDLDEKVVHRGACSLPIRFGHNIAFFVGDAQELPFCDSSFDAVVNFGVIHHVLDWRKCIREISRVMRPGGTFYFEEIYPPLYANSLLKLMLRHPQEDRFDEKHFLQELDSNHLKLVDGVRIGSRFRIIGAAVKR